MFSNASDQRVQSFSPFNAPGAASRLRLSACSFCFLMISALSPAINNCARKRSWSKPSMVGTLPVRWKSWIHYMEFLRRFCTTSGILYFPRATDVRRLNLSTKSLMSFSVRLDRSSTEPMFWRTFLRWAAVAIPTYSRTMLKSTTAAIWKRSSFYVTVTLSFIWFNTRLIRSPMPVL